MTWRRLPWVLAITALLVGIGFVMIPRGETAAPRRVALQGTVLPPRPAPVFALRDQFGRTISLSAFRGHPVIVTFMQSNCTGQCPVVVETLRRTLQELGPPGREIGVVAISADPEHDTAASVARFSRQHGMLHVWHYLLGTRRQLAPVWRAFYVYVAPANAPASLRGVHTSATYLIDGQGRERVLMTGDPNTGSLLRDLRLLAGLPVAAPVALVPAPQAGHPAPAFTLPELGGGSVSLRTLRGKSVLLNFWATWCTACKSEMPMLAAWYREERGRGIAVLGVDMQETPAQARSFARTYHIPYPILIDQSGAVSARYDVAGLPTTLVIDRQGVVALVRAGILTGGYLRGQVDPVVGSAHG